MSKVLVISGPTATGKTELGVELALRLGGEVVSADSMQLYKLMDIGTAKPTPEETRGVPHHMIDVVSPFERYSVSRYVQEAGLAVDDVLSRGRLPIIVGGTGLYIESLILGRDFSDSEDDFELRRRLEAEYDAEGGERMLEKLSQYDPDRAAKLHANDKKRIVRALELAHGGTTITRHDENSRKTPPRYEADYIILNFEERQRLYDRIDLRVDRMMERGLLTEVQSLLDLGLTPGHTAMQAIGYKELCAALNGEYSVSEAVELIKRSSRRYAKRQISWWTRNPSALRISWREAPNISEGVRISTEFVTGK